MTQSNLNQAEEAVAKAIFNCDFPNKSGDLWARKPESTLDLYRVFAKAAIAAYLECVGSKEFQLYVLNSEGEREALLCGALSSEGIGFEARRDLRNNESFIGFRIGNKLPELQPLSSNFHIQVTKPAK